MDAIDFIRKQLAHWPLAAQNYADLAKVETKQCGWAKVQHNPARIVSTGAKVDKQTIGRRPCFLCIPSLPKEQTFEQWNGYDILVNPYPIFPHHLTIVTVQHKPQGIYGRVADMCRLAADLPGFAVFYNGPKCGASAPDHMHFQAGDASLLPILTSPPPFGVIRLTASTPEEMAAAFGRACSFLPHEMGQEPMMNVLCEAKDGAYHLIIIPRKKHRPDCYGSGEGQMMISPASVDLGGLIITPRKQDFEAIKEADILRIFSEVCYSQAEVDAMLHPASGRNICVGITKGSLNDIVTEGPFEKISGDNEIIYRSLSPQSRVTVKNVKIGVQFHWERSEDQVFAGDMHLVPTGDGDYQIINVLPVEQYLASVISSEMSATSHAELLKAHAVISRSWLLAQIFCKYKRRQTVTEHRIEGDDECTVWYDHDNHTLFDVCADDHCQRYQGITRQTTAAVEEAVAATAGQVLTYDGIVCDARFSKCCGGAFELFENCWEPVHKPYLLGLADRPDRRLPDLTKEEEATKWILSQPEAFCNTRDTAVLEQVLNGYDLETTDFYRWKVSYTATELGRLIKQKSGRDFGKILDLQPLQRGTSGRIVRLRIVGTKQTFIVGKELEIRRWLSPSHLYSSAFVVERTQKGFTLHGAGWGHGVGLCQIGAAMMATKGYDYRQILAHYFPGAKIEKI